MIYTAVQCPVCGHVYNGQLSVSDTPYANSKDCPVCHPNLVQNREYSGYTTEEQSLPQVNDQPHIHDLVMADVYARKELGLKRYGTPLQPHNGRDALKDWYEELLDAACYARQLMEERMIDGTKDSD